MLAPDKVRIDLRSPSDVRRSCDAVLSCSRRPRCANWTDYYKSPSVNAASDGVGERRSHHVEVVVGLLGCQPKIKTDVLHPRSVIAVPNPERLHRRLNAIRRSARASPIRSFTPAGSRPTISCVHRQRSGCSTTSWCDWPEQASTRERRANSHDRPNRRAIISYRRRFGCDGVDTPYRYARLTRERFSRGHPHGFSVPS